MPNYDDTGKYNKILTELEKAYPEAACELRFASPFQLLISVVLSAQCTDKRVNIVTDNLFKIASTPEDFDAMEVDTLENYIHSCGFYHNKAKAIKSLSHDIIYKFNGLVPNTVEDLMKLSGVGRKTANVVYSVAFHGEAVAVDTHVFRVAHRLALSDGKTPDKVMMDLMDKFPSYKWYSLHHTMVFHGRYTCKSQRPLCDKCRLQKFCSYYTVNYVQNNQKK